MFDNVNQAIDWVISRRKSDYLNDRFEEYIAFKGNPQLKIKCLHVAGTNGKGSTTNYLRSILQAANYKVGSFTSPHLITHLDRIRINDENIEEDYFLNICNKCANEWEEYGLSMFQIDTYIAFEYFLEKQVDIVVYEVGLGGRLDSTNLIKPLGAVITNIEMDHMNILGDTIRKIAYEKAGIIKENIPVVTFEKKKEALDVFYEVAQNKKATIYEVSKAENVEINNHISFDYHNHHIQIPTIANYQILNASAAVTLIDLLNEKGLIEVSEEALLKGLNTFWAGRFEIVSGSPLVIIDGAHNENGIDGCCEAIDNLKDEVIIVFSALADKNYAKMIEKLMDKGEVVVTEFENKRSTTASNLALGYDVKVIADYEEAINYALSQNKTVVITGSLYFISIVREYFKNL